MNIVYPYGSKEIDVSDKIAIFTEDSAKVYYKLIDGNIPSVFYYNSSVNNEEVLLTPGSGINKVRIDAGANPVYYEVGSDPSVSRNMPILLGNQGAPTAKTVSATLTAAEVLTGIITVNQGAAGVSAQQLPLATAMDTIFPEAKASDSFDFSVINISTTGAEDASITTNTGWTLVGSMDVLAYDAAGTASSGRFRARKTADGAWTLYRIS